jgi:hypothetical protein
MKDLSVIIAHFDKYPLLTQKLANEGAARAYVLFFSFKRKMRRGGLDKSPRTKLSFEIFPIFHFEKWKSF